MCPGSRYTPSETTVKALYDLASTCRESRALESAADLAKIGIERGSAVVAPMIHHERMSGLIAATCHEQDVYTPEVLDMVTQLARVSAAALRNRRAGTENEDVEAPSPDEDSAPGRREPGSGDSRRPHRR